MTRSLAGRSMLMVVLNLSSILSDIGYVSAKQSDFTGRSKLTTTQFTRGPFTKIFRTFLGSCMPFCSKLTIWYMTLTTPSPPEGKLTIS